MSRRGLPQLIEGYGSERSIDARAARWLIAWMVVQLVVLCWGADVDRWTSVLAIAVGLAGLAVGLRVHRRLTGRDMLDPRGTLRPLDISYPIESPAESGELD